MNEELSKVEEFLIVFFMVCFSFVAFTVIVALVVVPEPLNLEQKQELKSRPQKCEQFYDKDADKWMECMGVAPK